MKRGNGLYIPGVCRLRIQ